MAMRISDYSTKFFTNNKSLSVYLNNIRKYTVPTVEEEEKLLEDFYKNGNEKAKNEIILRNQRFIYSLAKVYAKNEEDVLDYVNEGNIGMDKAFASYKSEEGYRFLTFAVWYIRREMNHFLCDTNNMVVRSNNMKLAKKIDTVKQDFFNENGYYPTEETVSELIMERYNINVKDIRDVYDVNVESINQELNDDFTVEDESDFNQKTASVINYEEDVEKEYNNAMVKAIFEFLEESLKENNIPTVATDIMKMTYGIGYERSYEVDEIAERFNMYPKDVTNIQKRVLKFLQQEKNKYSKIAV